MSLPLSEKQWLLDRAWTCLQYQQPQQACILLSCLLELFPGYFPAEKMLLVALLEAKQYPEVAAMTGHLLNRPLSATDKTAVYLCRSRAFFQLGDAENARESYRLYQESLNEAQV